MNVFEGLVRMNVAMTNSGRHRFVMRVPMMLVVDMPVVVGQRIMGVLVLMLLGEVQPDADGHQQARRDE